ncbi:Y-box-binding protein 1-like [Loxodonta africana]|uniref:Y-box-binding protein 1-like n=1 Tax=Loxodonta africana TaxID=9785 RepID=UPI0030CA84CC
MSEAGGATATEGASSSSTQAAPKHLVSLRGEDTPQALVAHTLSGDAISKATEAVGTKAKAPKRVIAKRTAIARNNPHKCQHSVGEGEAVECNVVQGELGIEAANVTRPAGVHVEGSLYATDSPGLRGDCYTRGRAPPRGPGGAEDKESDKNEEDNSFGFHQGTEDQEVDKDNTAAANRPSFSRGLCIRRRASPRDPRGAEGQEAGKSEDDGGDGRSEGFAATQGPRHGPLPVAGPTHQLLAGRPLAPACLARRAPEHAKALSYLLSLPRGRGTALGPGPSPGATKKPEAEDKESKLEVGDLQQRPPPLSNNQRCHPQPAPGPQAQDPEGGVGKTWKGSAETTAQPSGKGSANNEILAAAPAE